MGNGVRSTQRVIAGISPFAAESPLQGDSAKTSADINITASASPPAAAAYIPAAQISD
jgi:hypothetical protein